MIRGVVKTMAAGLLWLGLMGGATAQTVQISGTVSDSTGVIPNAAVTLKEPSGGTRRAETDAQGRYRFEGAGPGQYELGVHYDGYATATRRFTLAGEARTLDVVLEIAELSATINVTAVGFGGLANSVTAPTLAGSRLNIPALDTPASVTTLSGADIRLRGDATVNAAVTRAPGITSTLSVGGGGNTVAARGFGGSSVAFLYDGIRNMAGLGNLGWPYDPWTIDRIEVLNGPASVLYGIGGIGGSINVVPRRPNPVAQNTARLSAGSLDTYRLALDSTGPVTDRVLYRVDLSRNQSDGYIDRGRSESSALSGSLAFLLSPTLKFTVMNDWARIEPMNYNGLPLIDGTARRDLRKENYGTSDVDVHFNENSTRFELDWTPNPGFSMRNVSSLLYGDRLWQQGPTQLIYRPATGDVSRASFGRFEQDQFQWNHQIEATWRRELFGRPNIFVAGADGERLDFTRYVTQWPGQISVVSLRSPEPGFYPASGAVTTQAQQNIVHRVAGFAENRLEVTQALSLVGGIRLDVQEVDRFDLVTANRTLAERTYKPVSWRAGGVYEVRTNATVYAQYSKAIDAISNVCCITAAQLGFEPSRGEQIEAGFKQSTSGGRLEWTFAGYRIVKKDLLVPDPNAIGTLIQVGAQSSKGVEGTLSVDLGSGVRLAVNAAVLSPRYDEFFENVGGVRTSRNGNRPTNVPWRSANLVATWAFHEQWLAQGALRYVGTRYIDTANRLSLPEYTVVDASVRRALNDRIALDLRVANLFDEFYAYNFTGNGAGGGNWNVGAPRTYEAALTVGF